MSLELESGFTGVKMVEIFYAILSLIVGTGQSVIY